MKAGWYEITGLCTTDPDDGMGIRVRLGREDLWHWPGGSWCIAYNPQLRGWVYLDSNGFFEKYEPPQLYDNLDDDEEDLPF